MKKIKKCWLNNKTVILTGASSGIGRELTKTLITKNNCKVIGIGRSEEKILALSAELGEYKDNFSYKLFDVGDENNWKKFASDIKDTPCDILINNAGVLPSFASFSHMVEDGNVCEDVEKVMKTNFMSAVYSITYLSHLIEKSPTPAIINIDSSAGLCALPGTAIYSASKGALKNFTESISCERKYYIGLVCPGFTKTDIFRNQKNSSENKLISMVSSSLNKMNKNIYKGIKKKKKRLVLGMDAKAMDRLYRLMPRTSLKLFTSVLRRANIELFKDVF